VIVIQWACLILHRQRYVLCDIWWCPNYKVPEIFWKVRRSKQNFYTLLSLAYTVLHFVSCITIFTVHKYLEIINKLNALIYIYIYIFIFFTMAPTCFDKTMSYSGSDYIHFLATSASIWQETRPRTYYYIARQYVGFVICPVICLLPYWRWSGSERNIVAPWGWHYFAEICRSHRKRKIKKYIIQCI
jgi:hypothetical protein